MKVFVTGADGFLGVALVKRLLSAGHQVKVLIHSPKSCDSLGGLEVEKCFGDILDLEAMEKETKGVEAIFHLASLYKFYPWWQKKVPEIYQVNVGGTKNLLAAARKNKIKRFILPAALPQSEKGRMENPAMRMLSLIFGKNQAIMPVLKSWLNRKF